MYADNLLSITQNFLSPDIVNKFSSAIGESTEKTQKGLKSVIPSLLMGIVNKGQTSDGAENLVKLVNKDGFEGENVTNYNDENYLSMGKDAVDGIFGTNLEGVATKLGSTTGIQSSGIKKMMDMAAPLLMGVLGKKIRRENLSPAGLMNFLGKEKSTLNNLVPEGLVGRLSGDTSGLMTASDRATTEPRIHRGHVAREPVGRSPWLTIALVALGILAFVWWFTGSRRVADNEVAPGSVTSTERTVSAPTVEPMSAETAAPEVSGVSQVSAFLQSGSTDVPRTFRFENLNFTSGGATLMAGSESELDDIAQAMMEYPGATARIEGHSDNTGNEAMNVDLSRQRAEVVKSELVNRGVEASRLETSGVGSAIPVATNNSEVGRGENRRIEFILLSR